MKTNRKFSLGLLALIILCACARAPQEIKEKNLVPKALLALEDVRNSIVRIVSTSENRGVGNGFFVAPDKIATNIHLVADANPVTAHVRGRGGTRSIHGVTAYDVKNNLVILKVSVEGVPLPLGDSDAVKTGDAISADGFRARQRNRVAQGTILGIRNRDRWFSTTLTPDPELSGGPILNSKVEVIAVEVMEGEFGYAIPSNALKVLLAQSDAAEPLAQWQQRDVIRAYSYIEQAKRKFSDDDYQGMIEGLNEAIKLYPEFGTAYADRGKGKLYLGEFESQQGNVVEAQRHYNAAIADFNKVIELTPDAATVYKKRGFAKKLLADSEADIGNAAAQKYYHAAIADYTQAIERVPSDAVSYNGRGTARKNLGTFESNRGNVVEAQRHYDAAAADYTQAIKLKPDYANAYYGRGLTKEMIGQQEAAKSDLERAETLKRKQAAVRIGNHFGYASGFFVDRNKVATNVHVVARFAPVLVKSFDEETIWNVEGVKAFDVENDLVILQVKGAGTPFPLADSDALRMDEPVFAVGNSGGEYKITEGSVHSVRNSDKWIRLKINTSPGSSGSAILNSEGQVIGVDAFGDPLYGYVIPSNALKALLRRSGSTEPLAQWQKRKQISACYYIAQANHKYNAERYEEAIVDLNKALQLNSEFIQAYYARASSKLKLGMSETGLGNVGKARVLYQAAIEDLNETIKRHPDYGDAYDTRGYARFKVSEVASDSGNTEEGMRMFTAAINDYTQAIKLEPKGVRAYLSRGIAKSSRGKFKANQGNVVEAERLYFEAIGDLTQVIQLDPRVTTAYHHRGWIKSEVGDSEVEKGYKVEAQRLYFEAIGDLTQVIQLDPEDATAYSNRAWVRWKMGQVEVERGYKAKAREVYKAAVKDATQAIQLDPEYAYAYSNRGKAKYLLGESEATAGNMEASRKLYKEAIVDVDKSVQLDSNNHDAYYTRGAAKLTLNDHEGAIADFDKAIQIAPEHAKAYYDRGRAKRALGQREAAKADFQKAIELKPDIEK